eukprot:scaffold20929_cov30-Tisochrysis_lutea.AAC.2
MVVPHARATCTSCHVSHVRARRWGQRPWRRSLRADSCSLRSTRLAERGDELISAFDGRNLMR